MQDTTLHMIGNAHIDPVWLWQWQEGFQEVKATFRSVLDRMNECQDFCFTSSSAAFYEWIEHNDPQMFREIQARVAEGRWQIVGGWWIQPDCNLPCGESFVRQALYGQRYFKAKFGVMATVGYNVDSFGHHGMLPQILKQSGMDYYVFLRPEPHEKGLPGRLFWWESDDGSRVLAFRIPFTYCTSDQDLEQHVRWCASELKAPLTDLMCFYGVGNHGGGPTRRNLECIRRLNGDPTLPRLIFSTPNQFFAAVSSSGLTFPIVHDDLQHHASGCYAAHSGVKRWNRQAENLLIAAEKWSAVAARVTGQPYPADFAQAWKNVLFNQFHDILAGTSIEAAYDDARDMYGEAMAIAARGLNSAIQSLAWNISIPYEEGMKPIVVFNPHAWACKANIELEFGGLKEGDILVDDQGRELALQTVASAALVSGWRKRLTFTADLPALGYRVYRVLARPTHLDAAPVGGDDHTLENERFRLEIDPVSGQIARLYDKQVQVEVFCGPAARAVVIDDPSDTWSHGVYQYHDIVGTCAARRVRRVEHGPVKSVIRVESEYGASRLTQDFTMYRDLDYIDVHVTVDWHEQFKLLKLTFPLNLNYLKATFEIPYGHIERPTNGEEEPGQSWIDLSGVVRGGDRMYGLSLLNDGKYSFDVWGREMSMTVLRSPIYAHHHPAMPHPEQDYRFIDQGIQRFTYRLLPHTGGWEQAGTIRRAAELNQRPIALIETYHDGFLPQSDSYLVVDQDNIIVSVIKQAEDSDAMVIRCYEASKTATRATIRLPKWNRVIEATFGPCAIKTFLIPRNEALPVVETNLLEWVE